MNRYITSGLVLVGLLGAFWPLENAEAREYVVCTFAWADNPTMNVKGSQKYNPKGVKVDRKVRRKEYQRLVDMGRVPVRVSKDKGYNCELNHPENALIDTTLDKKFLRLDREGRMPNCADLQATARCVGRK
jgi:riboflavin biosynthesis pyrimidine reductase